MSQTCLVKFAEPGNARIAIRRLLQQGISAEAMEVMSAQPVHGEPFLPDKRPTKLRTWALTGAGVATTYSASGSPVAPDFDAQPALAGGPVAGSRVAKQTATRKRPRTRFTSRDSSFTRRVARDSRYAHSLAVATDSVHNVAGSAP